MSESEAWQNFLQGQAWHKLIPFEQGRRNKNIDATDWPTVLRDVPKLPGVFFIRCGSSPGDEKLADLFPGSGRQWADRVTLKTHLRKPGLLLYVGQTRWNLYAEIQQVVWSLLKGVWKSDLPLEYSHIALNAVGRHQAPALESAMLEEHKAAIGILPLFNKLD